jgi:hypothetical protein
MPSRQLHGKRRDSTTSVVDPAEFGPVPQATLPLPPRSRWMMWAEGTYHPAEPEQALRSHR